MPPKTDSSPPKEVYRLKEVLRAKEEAALEKRFFDIEKNLKEVREMAEEPHGCIRDETFQLIKDTFASGSVEFDTIHAKLDKASKVKFWSVVSVLAGIVLAALAAVYTYARNETNWEHTTERVQKVETATENIDKNVNGITVSFKLMEQSTTAMKEKLESVSPKKIEDAVSKGIKKASRNRGR